MPSRLNRRPAAATIRRRVSCLWSFAYRTMRSSFAAGLILLGRSDRQVVVLADLPVERCGGDEPARLGRLRGEWAVGVAQLRLPVGGSAQARLGDALRLV